jgi:predicted pyridoxine 5'-phosphate oxidase superfamily flavin-nucleotide-binding protein
MKLSKEQIDFINGNKWMVFATAQKDGKPRAAIVMPSRIEEDRIIISDVQMGKSQKNIRENAQAFVSSYKGDTQIKIFGTAKYLDSGKFGRGGVSLFEEIKKFEKTRDVDVKGIIVVKIQEIEQTEG